MRFRNELTYKYFKIQKRMIFTVTHWDRINSELWNIRENNRKTQLINTVTKLIMSA